ncbi:MAG TPA: putative 2OG-Fe(II) oxygenase, partial [Casimicrobiaceae bacterium]|nr:putative 2OG-Fe(II) oxygenase [Casimicrobiaceae bacterium]
SAYVVAQATIPAWPAAQRVEPLAAPLTGITTFSDHAQYHEALLEAVLAAERDPRFRSEMFRGACGIKVRDIARWGSAAANLVHARAITLAHRTLSRRAVFVDDCWASVYRAGDYCMPHSHLRANVGLVYMLDEGDATDDRLAGRLCFADPRIPACCPHEPGRVTNLIMPEMTPGTMVIFAADYLHHVNPYAGTRPRITLSWNVTVQRLAGRAGEGWEHTPT